MNYCRRIAKDPKERTVVFFAAVPPFPTTEYPLWAFWKAPAAQNHGGFEGHIIGESPDIRAERMSVYRAWHPGS